MPRTDEQNRARRAWASKLARDEAARPLTSALNSQYIHGYEKREVRELVAREPWQAPAELARVQALIATRAADPKSLHNWASRQRIGRALSATVNDRVSAPTGFWARDNQTTI